MKAVIIENEWEIDNHIQALIKDNPNLFESVQEELHCLHRRTEDLLPSILKNDTILVASTWMYKDQLEEFLEGFLNPKFPKKIVFAHYITNTLNGWKNDGFSDHKKLFKLVKKLYTKGFEIYDYIEDPNRKVSVTDKLTVFNQGMFGDDKERERSTYIYFKVKYSKKHDLFYIDHEHYNLKSQIEDEQENIKRNSR